MLGGPRSQGALQFHTQEYHVWRLWDLDILRKGLAKIMVKIDASRKAMKK